MENNAVEEGNKIIAEFMGMTPTMEYRPHSDWNELMPVVDEIEAIEVDTALLPPKASPIPKRLFWVSIQKSNITIGEDYKITGIAERFNYKSKIQATWECVVEFIKWYSQQQAQNK